MDGVSIGRQPNPALRKKFKEQQNLLSIQRSQRAQIRSAGKAVILHSQETVSGANVFPYPERRRQRNCQKRKSRGRKSQLSAGCIPTL